MKNIYIVTGANGFLGNNIVRKLIEKHEEVRALVLPNEEPRALKDLDCKIYRADVTKKETLKEIFEAENDAHLIVIHCAAIVYIKSKYSKAVEDVNIGGTVNIAEKCLEKNARLVYVNSVHSIPEKPNNEIITEIKHFNKDDVTGEYAKSKAEAAEYVLNAVKEKGLDAVVLHPSGIIGPGDFGRSHLTQMITDYANGKLSACVRGGYDFVDVRDVADGVISACEKGKSGECYILSNKYISVKELLDDISVAANVKKIKTVLPMWFAKVTAPLSEIYYKILKQPPLYTKYSLYTLTANANFSNEKAKRELGFSTRNIMDTLRDTVSWLREKGRIKA